MIVSRDWQHFRSLRWGRSQPGAVLWWACSPIGQFVVCEELKFSQMDPAEVVAEVKKKDALLRMRDGSRYFAAEPKLWEIDDENAPTLAEMFARAGMPLRKSSGDRVQGWNQLSALMKLTVTDPAIHNDPPRPALVIADSCTQLRRLIPLLREGQGAGVNAKEDIDTKTESSLVEALRVGAMSRPWRTYVTPVTPTKDQMGHALEQARARSLQSDATVII